MKTELTTEQAITLYTVIKALRNQFDAENLKTQPLIECECCHDDFGLSKMTICETGQCICQRCAK